MEIEQDPVLPLNVHQANQDTIDVTDSIDRSQAMKKLAIRIGGLLAMVAGLLLILS